MMEWIYYLICIIAIGFICVMGPILTLIYTFMMPWYVIMAYFAWIALSLLLISKHYPQLSEVNHKLDFLL